MYIHKEDIKEVSQLIFQNISMVFCLLYTLIHIKILDLRILYLKFKNYKMQKQIDRLYNKQKSWYYRIKKGLIKCIYT